MLSTTTLTKPILGAGLLLTTGLLVTVGVGLPSALADAVNLEAGDRQKSDNLAATPIGADKTRMADERIRSELSKPTEIDFIDTPLRDVKDYLADFHNIHIVLDEIALSRNGVKTTHAISQASSGISLQNVLKRILEPLNLTYVVAGGALKITATKGTSGNGPLDLSKRSRAEEIIEDALMESTQFEFVDTSLKDAMEFIAEQHKIQVVVNESELAEAGIAPDEPITFVTKDISLQSGLNIILKQLKLTYVIEDEVLKITTVAVEAKRKETRAYAVNSLLKAGFDAASLQRVVATQGEGQADIIGDAGVLVLTASQRSHRKVLKLLEQLQRAVEIEGRE